MLNKHYVANFRLSELFYHDILYWIKLGSYILSCTLQNFSFNQDVDHTRLKKKKIKEIKMGFPLDKNNRKDALKSKELVRALSPDLKQGHKFWGL